MKLSKTQENLVAMVKENLDKGYLWQSSWRSGSMPCNSKGIAYRGTNCVYLNMVAMSRGYKSNKWYTFNAIKEQGLYFKKTDSGKTMGEGAGVPVEYWSRYDKKTKKPFNSSILSGMSDEEAKEYLKENTYVFAKTAFVFNADLIFGLDEEGEEDTDVKGEESKDAMDFINTYGDKEVDIKFGGSEAYYNYVNDYIALPEIKDFKEYKDFYQVALHEISHSTGAEKRLNRDIKNNFGTKDYAQEELTAEFASLFLCQNFNVEFSGSNDSVIKNSAAYLDSWKSLIEEDEDSIIKAIQDAVKIEDWVNDWGAKNIEKAV